MNAETDFKAIWRRASIYTAPSGNDITRKAGKVKRKIRNRSLLGLVILAGTLLLIAVILYYSRPRLVTTVIGIFLECLAIIIYLAVSANLLRFLLKSGHQDLNVKQHLEQLLIIRTKQNFLQQQILTLYFILLAAGIFLLMIEYVRHYSALGILLAYGITFLWFLFNWVYLRPRTIRKQQAHLDQVIDQLTGLMRQLETE